MNTEIVEEKDKEEHKPNPKEVIGLKLFDKTNPEMITNVSVKDIDNLSVLSVIVRAENEYRKEKGYPKNIFEDVIKQNLVLRTSIKGWRSEQAVKIITSVLEEDRTKLDDGINSRLKKVIGR